MTRGVHRHGADHSRECSNPRTLVVADMPSAGPRSLRASTRPAPRNLLALACANACASACGWPALAPPGADVAEHADENAAGDAIDVVDAIDAVDALDSGVDAIDAVAEPMDTRDVVADEIVTPDGVAIDTSMPRPAFWREIQSATVVDTHPTASITITRPTSVQPGDVLLAVISIGNPMSSLPSLSPPPGWREVTHATYLQSMLMTVYTHVATSSEPSTYAWNTTTQPLDGVAWVADYAAVDATSPVALFQTSQCSGAAMVCAAPSLLTTAPDTLVVLAYAGHSAIAFDWRAPTGVTLRSEITNGQVRAGLFADTMVASPGSTAAYAATTTRPINFALVVALALRTAAQ
jgi:hypothetical protein